MQQCTTYSRLCNATLLYKKVHLTSDPAGSIVLLVLFISCDIRWAGSEQKHIGMGVVTF